MNSTNYATEVSHSGERWEDADPSSVVFPDGRMGKGMIWDIVAPGGMTLREVTKRGKGICLGFRCHRSGNATGSLSWVVGGDAGGEGLPIVGGAGVFAVDDVGGHHELEAASYDAVTFPVGEVGGTEGDAALEAGVEAATVGCCYTPGAVLHYDIIVEKESPGCKDGKAGFPVASCVVSFS